MDWEAEVLQQFHTNNFTHIQLFKKCDETLERNLATILQKDSTLTLNLITNHNGDMGQNEGTVILFSVNMCRMFHRCSLILIDCRAAAGLERDRNGYIPASSVVHAEETSGIPCWLGLLSETSGCKQPVGCTLGKQKAKSYFPYHSRLGCFTTHQLQKLGLSVFFFFFFFYAQSSV